MWGDHGVAHVTLEAQIAALPTKSTAELAAEYERLHGRQSNTDLLNAFLEHPQFAWLRPMSQLIVRIDEMLEDKAAPQATEVDGIRARAQLLTSPDESGDEYARRYHTALQENPDAVLAHRELVVLLTRDR